MAIIVTRNHKNPTRPIRKSFEGKLLEDFLQKYIAACPEIIPLDEIKKNNKWCIVAKELVVSLGQIDFLGVDKDGDLYIIETKRMANTSDRRKVIAQLLDYGASLWSDHGKDAASFWAKATHNLRDKLGVNLEDELRNIIGLVGDVSTAEASQETEDPLRELKGKAEANLRQGKFIFVVVMDQLPDNVKRVIVFLNEQHGFRILGVELDYYEHGDPEIEIVVPTIYGDESIANARPISTSGKVWDEESFFEALEGSVSAEECKVAKELLAWCKKEFGEPVWGKGDQSGRFSPVLVHQGKKYKPVYAYTSGVELYYRETMLPSLPDEVLRDELRQSLGKLVGVAPEALTSRAPMQYKMLTDQNKMEAFKKVILWWKRQVTGQGSGA